MFDYFAHRVWLFTTVRLKYWWWIVRYGGKKRIPSEVIFGAMEKTIGELQAHILDAVRVLPNDVSEEERLLARETMMKVSNFAKEVKKLQ